jgi:uncharacterized membrane protein YgdD (TMEM256/DUF423 family)
MMKYLAFTGAISGFLAVVLGAFAAHGLKQQLSPEMLAVFKTATDYQLFHALALVLVGFIHKQSAGKSLTLSALAFILGSLFFCGSLYALALGLPKILGFITPLGGSLFLVGWIALAVHAWPRKPSSTL